MNNELYTYKNKFYKFIAENRNLFDVTINEQERKSDWRIYKIQLQVSDISGDVKDKPLQEKIEILFEINFVMLISAYQELIVPNNQVKIDFDLSTEEGVQLFFQRKWQEIIFHLRAFNQEEDSYEKIAKLVQVARGSITATKYGL
jgi:hypothetical protein